MKKTNEMGNRTLVDEWEETYGEMAKFAPKVGEKVLCSHGPDVHAGTVLEVEDGSYWIQLEDGGVEQFDAQNVLKRGCVEGKAKKHPEPAKAENVQKTKRTYWCVLSEYEVGKRPRGWIIRVVRTKEPENFCKAEDFFRRHVPHIDTYIDWFNTPKEAEKWLQETLRAPELAIHS
jgi:hypothetical protein